ncbi:MAG: acyl-CoA dehydrogenase family protein, partial [Roseovarius indicus]
MTADTPLVIDRSQLWTDYVEPGFAAGIRRFATERIAPEADRIDREDIYPDTLVRALAREGYNTL